jgi:DEAD/DEAH box helicase domain-containing protein
MITAGTPRPLAPAARLSREVIRALGDQPGGLALRSVPGGPGLDDALANACREGEHTRATRLSIAASRLFEDGRRDVSGLGEVLAAIAAASPMELAVPFRAHHFVRMIRGVWACSDPDCGALADGERQRGGRRIGRLYSIPVARCECGARVLELLYCYQCGEVSLGGFAARPDHAADERPDEWYLSALSTSPAAAERPVFKRAWGSEYMWYWPGPAPAGAREWGHELEGKTRRFRFVPALFDSRSGYLAPAASVAEATGTMLSAPASAAEHGRVPALPERCPRCDSRGYNSDTRLFWRGVVRSPIRAHTTGTNRVGQIVLDRVVRMIGETPQRVARSSSLTAATTPPTLPPESRRTTFAISSVSS